MSDWNSNPVCRSLIQLPCAAAILVLSFAYQPTVVLAQAGDQSVAAETDGQDHEIVWFDSFEQAQKRARSRRSPMLVVAGADWCEFCKALQRQIREAAVQEELQRWLPVRIDVDKQPDLAKKLTVGPIPAIRVLSSDGRLVASQEGYLSANELVTWISSQYESAATVISEGLLAEAAPNKIEVMRILRELSRRDVTLREAAINRLHPHPQIAAPYVIAKLNSGSLAEQLASLELLSGWKAPVADLDPWVPESVTDERIDSLEEWAESNDLESVDSEEDSTLTPSEIIEVSRLLKLMATADDAAAAAMREQLTRMGPKVLPLLTEAIATESDELARQRYLAARYRLVAPAALAVNWPGGFQRLASPDFEERSAAADELLEMATSNEEDLLAAMISDPAPLIREMSLRGLRRVSGQNVDGALVKMLDDPDANVRAAVLKELVASAAPPLVPRIAEYVQTENDPDLVVHAVRLLREVNTASALTALLPLFEHASWRVRAESAESVSELLGVSKVRNAVKGKELEESLLKLLDDEDAFVVSRALSGLQKISTKRSLETLLRTTETHPSLAKSIVETISLNAVLRKDALPKLRQLCRHAEPTIRAAAITAVIKAFSEGELGDSADQAPAELIDALRDESATVQLAASDAVFASVTSPLKSKLRAAAQKRMKAATNTGSSGFVTSFTQSFIGGNQPKEVSPSPKKVDNSEESDDVDENSSPESERIILKFQQEQEYGDWLIEIKPEFVNLLDSSDESVQVAGARVLTLLEDARGYKVLLSASNQRQFLATIAEVLPVVPWSQRRRLFLRLTESATSAETAEMISTQFVQTFDPRSAAELWTLLSKDQIDGRWVNALSDVFRQSYTGERYYGFSRALPEDQARFRKDVSDHVESGTKWQKINSLLLLAEKDAEATVELAKSLVDDEQTKFELKTDALKVLLANEKSENAEKRSVALLESEEKAWQKVGLAYLALGKTGVASLSGGANQNAPKMSFDFSGQPGPIVPDLPEGITSVQLINVSNNAAPDVLAQAGYLLTLMDDPRYFDHLINYWKAHSTNPAYRQLAYRAISHHNDPAHAKILEQMYDDIRNEPYPNSTIKDFYWSIRIMTGSEALELRQRIREEQGADVLR